MDALAALVVRAAADEFNIDPNNLNLTTTDPALIKEQRKYCTIDKGCPLEWATMQYRPNIIGNGVYGIVLAVLLVGQLWFGIRKKTWTYMGAVGSGCLLEIVGYVGRIMQNRNPFLMRNFLMNLIPLTLAPALLTAGIYLCLGRVITVVGAENSRLKPKLVSIIFVSCDLVSLVLQAIGGALASIADDKAGSDRGVMIMIIGLISQVISMILFFGIWGDFALRARKAKVAGRRCTPPLYEQLRASKLFHWFQISLFLATVLIFIRCAYRVAELWGGFDSHLANDELTFMIFEGPMIISAVAFMTVFHPGRVFDDLWVPAGKGVRSMKHLDDSSSSIGLTEGWQDNTAYQRV